MINLKNIGWQARAAWKLVASMFKEEWTIDDYPIRSWLLPVANSSHAAHLKSSTWAACVINWPGMLRGGNTKLEALEQLRKDFDQFKATKRKLPRPGTKVPIEFASRHRLDQHPEVERDFVRRVLEIEWAWISDESSLWDFHGDKTNDRLNDKIRQIYGVDVSDISDGNLADIFDRIASSNIKGNVRT